MSTLTTDPFSVPPAMLQAVRAAYDVPPRAYHSWSHIEAVLRHVDDVARGPGWKQPREVVLAALFHDAIYDAGRKDNEARSAELARHAIAEHLPNEGIDIERVAAFIELTARHGAVTNVDPDAAHFLDADMAILGAPPHIFDAYDAGVATEYAPFVAPDLYRAGRRKFLTTLLAAPRIFLSDFFHQRYDSAARDNLRRAVDRL
ncbi:MAG: hypothetical protein JNG84_00960 [Archangium sp.]|nr:hypothetical protein [Archangium sp.]